jgi:hypothetical protein
MIFDARAITTSTLESGDIVSIESGKYRGCILTLVGVESGFIVRIGKKRRRIGASFVCLNSNEIGGYVRVQLVSFVRKPPTFDPAIHDDVMERDFRARLNYAQQSTGAK